MRILVPVDGSPNSMNSLEFIAGRTTLLGSNPTIELLNVQLPLPARACRLVGQDALTRYYEDEAEKVFEPARRVLQKVGFTANETFVIGEPAESITKTAEKVGADLIVMGSHGYGRFKSAVMGSTATRIAALGGVPLLIIRQA